MTAWLAAPSVAALEPLLLDVGDVIVSDAWTFLKNLGDRSHAARTPSI